MHTVLGYMGLGHCFLLDFVVLFSKVRLGVSYCSTIRLKDLPTSNHVWIFPSEDLETHLLFKNETLKYPP